MSTQASTETGEAFTGPEAAFPTRLGVLTNRLSTRNRSGGSRIHRVLSRYPATPHVEIQDWGRLEAAIAELAGRGVDAIAVNGGDGTVIGLLTALRRRSPFAKAPPLMVLAAGDTNMIAGDVGTPGAPHQVLARALAGEHGLRRELRRLIRVEQQGETVFYGLFVGAIGILRAIMFARRNLHPFGINHGLGNVVAMALSVSGVAFERRGMNGLLAGVPVEIGFDDEPMHRDDYSVFLATTLDRLLFGARPFWGTGEGAIRTTLVRSPADRPLCSLLPMLRGRPTARMLRAGYVSRNAEQVRLAFDGSISVDGEIREVRRDRPVVLSDGGSAVFLRY